MAFRLALVLLSLAASLLAGCFSTGAPTVPPAGAPPTPAPIANEGAEAGLFTADRSGALERQPSLPGWTVLADGTLHLDVTQVVEADRMQLYLFQALAPQRVHSSSRAHVEVLPSVIGGEQGRNHGTCFSTLAWPSHQGGFYIDRLRGLDPQQPAVQGDGYGHGSAHSEMWLASFGGSYQHNEFDTWDLAAGEWVVVMAGVSQVPPADVARDGNAWNVTLSPTAAHRLIALPGAPMLCLFGLKSMPGARVDQLDVAFDGNLTFESPYGAAVKFSRFEAPGILTPLCPPVGAHEARITFNGDAVDVGDGDAYAKWSYDRSRVTIDVQEWGCQSRQLLAAVGVPEPLTGMWWDETADPIGNATMEG